MKTIFKFALSLAIAPMVVLSASAQEFKTVEELDEIAASHNAPENNNRHADGKIDRGSYLTNAWYDNWTFGLAGGIQLMLGQGNSPVLVSPDVELNVTKWVTPTFAARFGYQGFRIREVHPIKPDFTDHYKPYVNDKGQNIFNQMYFHFDLMLGLSNLIGGYKETRLVNVIPYLHAGYYQLSHPKYNYFTAKDDNGEKLRDREIAFGPAVLLNFRLTNSLALTCDIRDSFLSSRYHEKQRGGIANDLSIALGLSYTIHKWYWVRHTTSIAPLQESYKEATVAYAEAKEQEKKLEVENKVLEDELAQYRKKAAEPKTEPVEDELSRRAAAAGLVVYFDINSDKLPATEALRLEQYVHDTLASNGTHVFYLTGSADKGTGNERINTRLSSSRAENIKKLLHRKYGISEGQIVIKATIISDKHEDGRLDRCVMFENE